MESKTAEPARTFKELMAGSGWRSIRAALRRSGETIRVAESEVAMGRYCAVVLNGDGFMCESGKGGIQAAFSGGNKPTLSPIKPRARVLECIREYDESLPPENELVAGILAQVAEIRRSFETAKRKQGRKP